MTFVNLRSFFFFLMETKTVTRRALSVCVSDCLPPSLPLPLLSCDVFWPDSMAPGRQWHDHRNRGQKGHSSLLVNLERSLAILPYSFWNHLGTCFIFSLENNSVVVQHVGDRFDRGLVSLTVLLIQPPYHGNPPLMPRSLNMSGFWLYGAQFLISLWLLSSLQITLVTLV